jgi:curved DNA-binding protein CbpA
MWTQGLEETMETATRKHRRQTYVALLFGLHVAGRTGVLEVKRGRNWRRLWLACGVPVRYRSSLEGESNGTDPKFLERASVAALGWPNGTWSFDAADKASPAIDPELLPDLKPLRALWTEVRKRIDMEEAASLVSAPEAGNVEPTGSLEALLASFGIKGPLARLGDHLPDAGCTVDELFRKTQDKSGHLLHLLWLLETIGMVRRSGRSPDQILAQLAKGELAGDEVGADSEVQKLKDAANARRARSGRSQPSSPGPRSRYLSAASGTHVKPTNKETLAKLPGLLKTARKHRIRKNFYEFFDLSTDATRDDVEAAYKRLAQLWRGAAQTSDLPREARKDAHDLVQGALIVWRTLSDKDKRFEYDKRLRQGRAPLLEALIASSTGGKKCSTPGDALPRAPGGDGRDSEATKAKRARRLVDKADFVHALPLLRDLRLENPSDPNVLADLGWTTWRLRGDKDPDSADEFLQLSLTFDPTNNRAMQYLARMAKEQGRDADARRLVERLLAVDPGDEWANRALRSFARAEAAGSRRGKRRGR